MNPIATILFLLCLICMPMRVSAGTHELGGSFAHAKMETTSKFGPFKMDIDQYSDTYSLGYSYYSTNLKENPYPELAILNSHPSFLSVNYNFSRYTSDDTPSSEYSNYRIRGRYSFPSGIGLGGGLWHSDADRSPSSSDSNSYDVSLSLDYSVSPQSNILLQLDRIETDSDDGQNDSDGYTAYVSGTIAIDDSYIVAPFVGYATQDGKGRNTTDITNFSLGLNLGLLCNESLAVYVGGQFSKLAFDGRSDGDSDAYRIFISPKYWFNRSADLSLTFEYRDQSGDFGPIEMDATGYSGAIAFGYRF